MRGLDMLAELSQAGDGVGGWVPVGSGTHHRPLDGCSTHRYRVRARPPSCRRLQAAKEMSGHRHMCLQGRQRCCIPAHHHPIARGMRPTTTGGKWRLHGSGRHSGEAARSEHCTALGPRMSGRCTGAGDLSKHCTALGQTPANHIAQIRMLGRCTAPTPTRTAARR
jgi:hypothetical protein